MNNQKFIFLPGWGFKASIWNEFIQTLRLENAFALDLPSEEDDFDIILHTLAKKIPSQSIIIAWSLGGLLAIALCEKYPDACRKLILFGSTPRYLEDDNWPGISASKAYTFLKHANHDMDILLKKFYSSILYPHPNSKWRDALIKHIMPAKIFEKSLLVYLNILITKDLRRAYQNINIPIIHIIGDCDLIIPATLKSILSKINCLSHIIVIPGGSHIPFLTHLKQTIIHLENILKIPDNIRKTFNKAIHTYDDHSHIQQVVGNKLISMLHKHKLSYHSIIDLGCGTGIVTKKLAMHAEYQKFHAIDIADQFVTKASARLAPYGIRVFKLDFQNFQSHSQYDLIFSNMALHWAYHFKETLKFILQYLKLNGHLVFTIPLNSTFHELPTKNIFVSLETIKGIFIENNLEIIECSEEIITQSFSSSVEALKSIKAVGANHLFLKTKKGLTGKSTLLQYPKALTYHIGYFMVKKTHAY